ncbi:MAG: TolC family protein [bacterium]|nr:TolC family protein [bacterium]
MKPAGTIMILFLCLFVTIQDIYPKENREKKERTNNSQVNSVQKLVTVTLKNHPRIKVLSVESDREKSLEKIAGQGPNLEFDSRLLYTIDNPGFNSEFSLKHTFELGGKQSDREKEAKRKLSLFEKKVVIKKQEIVSELLLSLYRLRQVKDEIAVIRESINTYYGIRTRYRKLPRLSPEQEISLTIYSLAENENRTKLRMLKSEQISLEQKLKLFTGLEKISFTGLLPKGYTKWPEVINLTNSETMNSPLIDVAAEELKLNEASYNVAQSGAWPNLGIGPSVSNLNTNSINETEAGVAFSFTIPLYHQNQGEREYAKRSIRLSKANIEAVKKELLSVRKAYVLSYRESTKNFKKVSSHRLRDRKHAKLHRFLRRGLVSTGLVIEYHRQEFELLKTRNENEMNALQALWSIYAIDGVIFKEGIHGK